MYSNSTDYAEWVADCIDNVFTKIYVHKVETERRPGGTSCSASIGGWPFGRAILHFVASVDFDRAATTVPSLHKALFELCRMSIPWLEENERRGMCRELSRAVEQGHAANGRRRVQKFCRGLVARDREEGKLHETVQSLRNTLHCIERQSGCYSMYGPHEQLVLPIGHPVRVYFQRTLLVQRLRDRRQRSQRGALICAS